MARKKKNKKAKVILVLLLLILLAGAIYYFLFFDNKKLKTNKDNKTEEKVEVKKLKIVDENSSERSIAVMINNHKQARPHSGLQDAYIVYEAIAEGGLTRMMAIYKGASTSVIGSVRSSRPYFLDYALENDAIYVHYGWSEQAKSDISTLGVNNINGLYDSGFWREKGLNVDYEHTAFTSIEKIKEVAQSKKYRTTTSQDLLLNYSVDEINILSKENATIANNVTIPYSYQQTTSYTYDSTNKVYLRYINGEAHKDRITGNQYTVKNIIISKINNYSVDSYGRQALDDVGSGDGYYITNGYSVPIKWAKSSRSSQTVYSYLDGTEITVNDGNTFIQIEPTNQTTTITE